MQDKHLPFAVVSSTFVSITVTTHNSRVRLGLGISSVLREKFLPPDNWGLWLARFHRPDRASSGVELLASSAAPGPAMNGGLPGFRTPPHLSNLPSPIFSLKKILFDFPYLCSSVTSSILARFDLVLRRQCAGVEGRGRRRSSLLHPLRLPRPLPRPRPVLPGKAPLPSPMHVY